MIGSVFRLGPAALPRVDQVCMLVEDIEEGIAAYSDIFPATTWRGFLYSPETIPELGYRGAKGECAFWVALSDCDPQIELIQSVSGPSIYTEWLDVHGFGFHHLGIFTKDMATDVASLEARGLEVSQWGRGYGLDGDGAFTYFDSLETLGVVLELIEIPKRRREPDREWIITR